MVGSDTGACAVCGQEGAHICYEAKRRQWLEGEARAFWERAVIGVATGGRLHGTSVIGWADEMPAAWRERFMKPAVAVQAPRSSRGGEISDAQT